MIFHGQKIDSEFIKLEYTKPTTICSNPIGHIDSLSVLSESLNLQKKLVYRLSRIIFWKSVQ